MGSRRNFQDLTIPPKERLAWERFSGGRRTASAKRLTVARSFDSLPKYGKSMTMPIPVALLSELVAWKEVCPPSSRDLVCPIGNCSKDGLARLLKEATCPPLFRGWHALRHTFASVFVEQGGSIVALKESLCHSSIDMSLVYSHLSPDALIADVEKMKLS